MRVKKTVNCWWFIDSITWRSNALCLPPSAWWLPFATKAHGYWKKNDANLVLKWSQRNLGVDPGLLSSQRLELKQLDIYFTDGQFSLPVHLKGSVDTHTGTSAPPLHAHSCTDTCGLHVCMNVHVCICSLTSQGRVHSSVFFPRTGWRILILKTHQFWRTKLNLQIQFRKCLVCSEAPRKQCAKGHKLLVSMISEKSVCVNVHCSHLWAVSAWSNYF